MRIQRLSRKQKPEAVSVLTAAFHDYPVMRFVLRTSGDEYEKQLEALIDFFCEVRYARNWPILGIQEDDIWAAVLLVNEPVHERRPMPRSELLRLKENIGGAAFRRLVSYEQESSRDEPTTPHHFLGMIGVRPELQGKGYARALLEKVKEMSQKDPTSMGVFLNTESADNIPLYERFGYKIIAEVDIDDLHSWCMFLPT